MKLLMFSLDEHRYALRLSAVQYVAHAVEITCLPCAPEIVMGVINAKGKIVPVVNVRRRFGLPERDIELSDQFVIARTSHQPVALVVDAVNDIVSFSESDVVASENIWSGLNQVAGVLKLRDGIILVHDLDRFLSSDEEQALDRALTTGATTS